ncbi:hypothetical protein OE88DRAFT_1668676 [Heliocybe sulcata]|uniref:Uncharacterized protein n=1 Tax=Heliocybe sulcata TaxID=5364 RepID=A0A5C3MKI4_9AGAM|nr:hypothetical protein OE88DRAFT_1668676 [Heliocybe sulcata]
MTALVSSPSARFATPGSHCHNTPPPVDAKPSYDWPEPPSHDIACSSQRTLRRKRRMSSLRAARSHASLRQCTMALPPRKQPSRKSLTAPVNRVHSRPFSDIASSETNRAIPSTKATTAQQPTSEPIPIPMASIPFTMTTSIETQPVKLGHPGRPYYTAIRKNMTSRPPLVLPPPVHDNGAVSPSPSRDMHRPVLRQALSYPYTIPSSQPSYSFNSPTGFSLSGETELRMALSVTRKRETQSRRASLPSTLTRTLSSRSSKKNRYESENASASLGRRRARTVVESPSEFRFVERPKGVKGRIQMLGQGVRQLFG